MRILILIAVVASCSSATVAWYLHTGKQEVATNLTAAEYPLIVVPEVIELKPTATATQKISATIPEDAPKPEPKKKNPFRMKQKIDEDTPAKPDPVKEPKPAREAETPVDVPQIAAKKVPVLESDYEANHALVVGETLYIEQKHDQAETQLLSVFNYWKKQTEPDYSKLADTAYWLGSNQYQQGAGNPLAGANWLHQSLNYEEKIVPARTGAFRKSSSLYILGNCYRDLQSYKKAEDFYLAAKSTCEVENNFGGIVDSFDRLRSLYITTGQTSRIQSCTNEIRRLIPERLGGNLYYVRRLLAIEYDECVRDKKYPCAKKFLDQIKELDADNPKSRLSDQAYLAEMYASLYFAMSEPEVALTYSETAFHLWESHYKDDLENPTLGGKYYNFGHKLIEYKQYERGHKYLLRALTIWDKPHCSCHV